MALLAYRLALNTATCEAYFFASVNRLIVIMHEIIPLNFVLRIPTVIPQRMVEAKKLRGF